MRPKRVLVLLLGLATVFATPTVIRYWRAQRLLLALGSAPAAATDDVRTQELTIPGRARPIRARLYFRPDHPGGQGLVVAHGVHYQGIDERRLVPFARALARAGLVVLTPALDDLADYRIDPRSVGELVDSVRYLSGRADLVDRERVGLLGFSFGGGLALLAAGEPGARERISHVVSIGGYHDLSRVLGFFVTGLVDTPDGPVAGQPHEYGPLVLIYRHLDRLMPAADRSLFREVLRAWLREDFARARALAARRSSLRAEELFTSMETHDLARLRPQLEQLLAGDSAALEQLSPRNKLSRIEAPVYLLHGSGDTVIPASEARWAGAELASQEHEALISPLLEHVEVSQQAGLADQLALLRFMANAL